MEEIGQLYAPVTFNPGTVSVNCFTWFRLQVKINAPGEPTSDSVSLCIDNCKISKDSQSVSQSVSQSFLDTLQNILATPRLVHKWLQFISSLREFSLILQTSTTRKQRDPPTQPQALYSIEHDSWDTRVVNRILQSATETARLLIVPRYESDVSTILVFTESIRYIR